MNGGKDHNNHNGKKPKLSFDELLAKYLKENEAKYANWSNDVKSSRLPPKHNSRSQNWQGENFHSATSYSHLRPLMSISYTSHPTHHYSSWGKDDSWGQTPSYFRPYHIEYAAPRESACAGQQHIVNGHFKTKNRSRVENKKKVVKKVYVVKKDSCKATSSYLNSIAKKPINVLMTWAIDGKGKEKLSVDIPGIKSRWMCRCPKLKYDQDTYLVYQISKGRSSINLVPKS